MTNGLLKKCLNSGIHMTNQRQIIAGVIDLLEFGDGCARYEESGEHHEHPVDVETGEVIEFYHAKLEALKEQIAHEMGYELVDHRLELFGRKINQNKVN